jgi:quercetin dioxygenase-like cupin family protein
VRGAPLPALLLAGLLPACGDGSGDPPPGRDPGSGLGALGGGARTETLARTELDRRPPGDLVWVADEIRLPAGEAIEHIHELGFAYARSGGQSVRAAGGDAPIAEGEAVAVRPGVPHRHDSAGDATVLWEIRLARPGAPPPPGTRPARRVFESEPLEGVPAPAAVSLIEVTVPPRGGRTTVHTHPGPEFIYQLSGRIDYQNAIAGTKLLAPGGAEGIPPGTAVQKRNPYPDPAAFLSLFLVDPDRPFAPKASF